MCNHLAGPSFCLRAAEAPGSTPALHDSGVRLAVFLQVVTPVEGLTIVGELARVCSGLRRICADLNDVKLGGFDDHFEPLFLDWSRFAQAAAATGKRLIVAKRSGR